MIHNSEHCLICENQQKDFKAGVYCGLTGEKARFLNKCSEKVFETKMLEHIVSSSTDLRLVENMKSATYLHLYTYLAIAIAILIADGYFINYLIDVFSNSYTTNKVSHHVIAVPIIIGSVGLGLIPVAIAPLNKYRRRLKIAKNDLTKLDILLNVYNIKYDIQQNLIKAAHDSIDIESELTVYRKNREEKYKFKKINAGTTINY